MHHVYDVILKRRSIRRFKPKPVPEKHLLRLVEAARFAPSAANLQPCEYVIVNQPRKINEMYDCVKWREAAFPSGPPGPQARPTAYIVVLVDLIKRRKGGGLDAAAAVQNVLLTACELGLGSCWIDALHRKRLKKFLRIPHHLQVAAVVALGFADEAPGVEEADGPLRPWTDPVGRVRVPKRRLADICYLNGYRQPAADGRR
jgi:nitroreductase